MQVALLTFHDNPYDDYGRPVPPEMFFGRNTELRRLRNVKSAAVLFGGRRLGKSSLLDQLERDADDRNGEVVLYLALDRTDHGLSDDHVFLAWDAILRKLIPKGNMAHPLSFFFFYLQGRLGARLNNKPFIFSKSINQAAHEDR